jgi:hypothetical protein
LLLRREVLERIARGEIRLLFRCWQRPTVRTGGSLLTALGKLHIASVDGVERSSIAADAARLAGYGSLEELRAELERYPRARVYRIELGELVADPRVALRDRPADEDETRELKSKLAELDRRAAEPWTAATLELIARRPQTRAALLARELGQEREPFKLNVRKLKNLGLTESLELGYRLSPRGEGLLRRLRSK